MQVVGKKSRFPHFFVHGAHTCDTRFGQANSLRKKIRKPSKSASNIDSPLFSGSIKSPLFSGRPCIIPREKHSHLIRSNLPPRFSIPRQCANFCLRKKEVCALPTNSTPFVSRDFPGREGGMTSRPDPVHESSIYHTQAAAKPIW